VSLLPASLRRLTPPRLRDDVRIRAAALAAGLIPPRAMHSEEDLALLRAAAARASVAVEIGVYEGASALVLLEALPAGAELHLIDPFGHHPDALPAGWGASEAASRRTVARARRRLGLRAPPVRWHIALSHVVARDWAGPAPDLVFIDGDHSEEGCERDWRDWSALLAPGGSIVLHDARAGRPGGRGLPGPTAVVERQLRGHGTDGFAIVAEADRTVVARCEH
jgi:predicted O-methyltransferase YrrM